MNRSTPIRKVTLMARTGVFTIVALGVLAALHRRLLSRVAGFFVAMS